ncbi:threonine aldolase family protein [Amaricoccus tamworthensis]|uniref:threonine aldolase family protein n=1 Tax=Amaricoccus tamworthensis TaxID=57002 RepID=UPI003C7DB955
MTKFGFVDDYSEGAHPAVLAALADTNARQEATYGLDRFSTEAAELIRGHLGGAKADIHFVPSGTIANTLCIASALRPHEAVIAATSGHISVHETGAIEATGHKVITVTPENGKLTPDLIRRALAENAHFPHMAKPRMVYISNATEVGTVYSLSELTAISGCCRENNLLLMLDGARIGAAVRASDVELADVAALADIFWIGGTKNGALLGEAVVIPNRELAQDFAFHVKQRGALLAKGRVLGVQFRALFTDNLYFSLADHANAMATDLSKGVEAAGFKLLVPTQANQVFPVLTDPVVSQLREKFDFHSWGRTESGDPVIRLVTSWATPQGRVQELLHTLTVYDRAAVG